MVILLRKKKLVGKAWSGGILSANNRIIEKNCRVDPCL
jgi:hypothetical protein